MPSTKQNNKKKRKKEKEICKKIIVYHTFQRKLSGNLYNFTVKVNICFRLDVYL